MGGLSPFGALQKLKQFTANADWILVYLGSGIPEDFVFVTLQQALFLPVTCERGFVSVILEAIALDHDPDSVIPRDPNQHVRTKRPTVYPQIGEV
jgi:hypothetical protein